MVAEYLNASQVDRIAAYALTIESLPTPSLYAAALRSRGDCPDTGAVFAVIAAIRMECQIRVGNLRAGDVSERSLLDQVIYKELAVAPHYRNIALRMALDNLPREDMWAIAIRSREDGSTPLGVFAAIGEFRMELHRCIDDLNFSVPCLLATVHKLRQA